MNVLREAGLLAAALPSSTGGAGLGSDPGNMGSLLNLLTTLGSGNLSGARTLAATRSTSTMTQAFWSIATDPKFSIATLRRSSNI